MRQFLGELFYADPTFQVRYFITWVGTQNCHFKHMWTLEWTSVHFVWDPMSIRTPIANVFVYECRENWVILQLIIEKPTCYLEEEVPTICNCKVRRAYFQHCNNLQTYIWVVCGHVWIQEQRLQRQIFQREWLKAHFVYGNHHEV